MLYNANFSSMLLGCLMLQPNLLFQPSFPLSKKDFSPEPFHQILFICIAKVAQSGAEEITEVEIENYAKNFPAQLETLVDNNYFEFISTVKELCVLSNYEMYYTAVRKFGLLRELKEQGFDIKDYFDELQDEDGQMAKLNEWSIQDILGDIELKGAKLRGKYDVKYVRNEITAGEHTQELINNFKQRPAFGALFQSGYLSTIWNGWSRGHLVLRGGASSSGKSRCSVADLCNVGMLELWDDEAQDFIPNLNYQSPTLFIATEQDIETEVEPMFLAAVSGVEYRRIVNGLIDEEETKRVLKAGEIIQQSHLDICSMPNFTVKGLERKIKEKVENNGIEYMVFDYMEVQADLSAEFKAISAVTPRQDLILLNLTSELKRIAEDNLVGILTGMQLNDGWKEARFIDESFLAGSKAAKNKIDNGSIIVPTTYLKKDMKILEATFNSKRRGFGANRQHLPNICETIFKGRYSIYGDRRLRLWSYFDRGTFRRYDYFVTDDNNDIQRDIKPSVIKEEF